MTYNVKKVEKIIPENITTPTVNLLASPGPDPIIRGTTPAIVDNEVIRIGLSLIFAASKIAFSISLPSALNWFANSTIRIPFLAARPIKMIRPIWL